MKENRETNDMELSATLNNVDSLNMFNEETRSIIFFELFCNNPSMNFIIILKINI